ncbi:uncharacterized protein LOC18035062 isoform X2 [Citrus clementina]|uniref:uncharacterized protein LOC18035062 isoform X2 n=1 Tax=Citrus clementina TaxID=85681 RepID=UPI000CED551B|nr:uncharacterized protein LOC18035062 isoform X2 [Citrus x clementina]
MNSDSLTLNLLFLSLNHHPQRAPKKKKKEKKTRLLMALPMQRSLLRSFVQSMHEEGIVNDDFYQLLAMKETVRPDYVVRAVTSYCLSAQNLFSHLTYHICQPEVDYHQVNTAACEFYARTSSCSRALYWTKNEYSKLRRKFETLVQMERKIIDLENGH